MALRRVSKRPIYSIGRRDPNIGLVQLYAQHARNSLNLRREPTEIRLRLMVVESAVRQAGFIENEGS